MTVRTQAMNPTRNPAREPTTPAPSESKKAMKARPQAMGCRIMTRVRPSEVPVAISENEALLGWRL